MKQLFLFLSIYLSCSTLTWGQNTPSTISTKNLKADLELLVLNLKTVHAGLYTYHSKEKFDEIFQDYQNLINRDMTAMEFYRTIGTLTQEVGDAHTEIEPPESFYDTLNHSSPVFPISVKWLNEKLYAITDFSDEQIVPPGTHITAINGIPSKDIYEKIRAYVPRDGQNLTSPNHTLSGTFGQFRNYYAAIYGTPKSFTLEIRDSNDKSNSINIKGLKYQTIFDKYDALKAKNKSKVSNKPLQFEIKDQVAILKVKSFHPGQVKEAGQNYKKFFKKAFKKIRKSKVNKLVIDIRGNGGGHQSVFIELFKYLTHKPFQAYRQLSTSTDKIPNPELYLEKEEIADIERWASKNLTPQKDRYLVKNELGIHPTNPKKKNYSGPLYILIDGASSSAAGDFSGLVKADDRAIFIGEETGGNPYSNTAGNRLTLVLPHSQLQIIIPTLLYEINIKEQNDGHGMKPDHAIFLSIDDYLQQKDKAMEYILK